ncbi:hypothetical protein EDB80DRAFT_573247, partial [Ilyonectria destructans]
PLLQAAIDKYGKLEGSTLASGPLQLNEGKELILKLFERYKDATVTIIIDALDECRNQQDLSGILEDLLEVSPCLIKVFVSSREDQGIVYRLGTYPNLHLSSNLNSRDIELFIQSETDRLIKIGSLFRFSAGEGKAKLRNQIIQRLTSDAQGMQVIPYHKTIIVTKADRDRFRWADLQLKALQELRTEQAVIERLGRLPKTLKRLYQEILNRIEDSPADADKQIARNALCWLLCGQEQFESSVFLVAVTGKTGSVSLSKDQLLDLCCNLVIYDHVFDTFRFSHLLVREFFEGQVMFKPETENATLTEDCLFNIDKMGRETITEAETQLLNYSCYLWLIHAREALHRRQLRLRKLLCKFFSGEQDWLSSFGRWHRRIEDLLSERGNEWHPEAHDRLDTAISFTPSALLIICAFDLTGILDREHWIQQVKRFPTMKLDLTYSDVLAACNSTDLIPFDKLEYVISIAAESRRHGDKAMKSFLDKLGAEVKITEEVIMAAITNYSQGEKILEFLLDEREAEIQITEEVIKTAIQELIHNKEKMLFLFDKRGAEIHITEEMMKAAIKDTPVGKVKVAILVDNRTAKVQITEEVLKAAIENTHQGKEILFDKCGGEIQITEELMRAAVGNTYQGRQIIVFLLDRCESRMLITEQIIKDAAAKDSKELLELLLDRRAAEMRMTEDVIRAAARDIQRELPLRRRRRDRTRMRHNIRISRRS